jgi:hypothetical protein
VRGEPVSCNFGEWRWGVLHLGMWLAACGHLTWIELKDFAAEVVMTWQIMRWGQPQEVDRVGKTRHRQFLQFPQHALLAQEQPCSRALAKLYGAAPGIEPGTSRTRSENHATRPSSQVPVIVHSRMKRHAGTLRRSHRHQAANYFRLSAHRRAPEAHGKPVVRSTHLRPAQVIADRAETVSVLQLVERPLGFAPKFRRGVNRRASAASPFATAGCSGGWPLPLTFASPCFAEALVEVRLRVLQVGLTGMDGPASPVPENWCRGSWSDAQLKDHEATHACIVSSAST